MTLLGTAEVRLDGQRLLLNRRQTEVLALLALHPEGLSLDRLHALVYGDQAVTFSTLKAEVSHLRAALGGQLSSRPYRLMMPVATDVEHVLDLLRRGRVADALDAYGGDLLPGTNSPGAQRARRVRRGRGARGAARRPRARRGPALRRPGAVRHRGGRALPGRSRPRPRTRPRRCSRASSPLPRADTAALRRPRSCLAGDRCSTSRTAPGARTCAPAPDARTSHRACLPPTRNQPSRPTVGGGETHVTTMGLARARHDAVEADTQGSVRHDQDRTHRRRSNGLRRRRTADAAGAVPAGEARQDRHRHRVRHQQLRCVHRPPRRHEREVVQRPGRPGRRQPR